MADCKSIIILSEKSSGSSACQDLLEEFANARHVAKTRHFENETLYWTKAASILGRPQRKMVDSEVPIATEEARSDLITLLRENLDEYQPPSDDERLIMEGWRQLCRKHVPIFLEKSPHHLCQWSAIELILEAVDKLEDIDFLLIGLIRNPLDTIHSHYRRWKSPCADVEKQWRAAYGNLLRLRDETGARLVIVRYEDMVSSIECMRPVFEFCEVELLSSMGNKLHRNSVNTAQNTPGFGFVLSEETRQLAEKYGYTREETANEPHLLWPLVSRSSRWVHLALKFALGIRDRLSPAQDSE